MTGKKGRRHEPAKRMTRLRRFLAPDDFEVWRPRMTGLLILTSTLLATYWLLWFTDRSLVASEYTSGYIDFEQSFLLADALLAGFALLAAVRLWGRRMDAVIWLAIIGGAGMYLCAMDVLYDLQHGIYAKSTGGGTEFAINTATAALSIGVVRFAWRFRKSLGPTHVNANPFAFVPREKVGREAGDV